MRPSPDRRLKDGEFTAAFADAIEDDATPGHYPVVFGVVAAERGLSRLESCLSHAYSFVTGLLGAAQRLGRFGHTEIQSVLEEFEAVITAGCECHVDDDSTAMASFAPMAEIMGMRHERAGRRLFMSYSRSATACAGRVDSSTRDSRSSEELLVSSESNTRSRGTGQRTP